MGTDLTPQQSKELEEIGAMGLEEVSHKRLQKKYISLDKDSGLITIDKGATLLGDNKKQFKITPLFMYDTWEYVSLDGMTTYSKELIDDRNHNVALLEEEEVTVKDYQGHDQKAKRAKGMTILALVQDHESFGPMFLGLRRQKLWNAQSIISKWVENRAKKIPIFGQEFLVSSEQKTNKKGQKYYVYKFQASDVVTDYAKLVRYSDLYKDLKNSQDRLLHQAEEDSGGAHE